MLRNIPLRRPQLLLVLLAVAEITYSQPGIVAAVQAPKDRQHAPDFTIYDGSGPSVRLSDYKGKVILLNFWATWAGPCKIDIPRFIEFQKAYKDRGFAVLGVSMDADGWKAVKPYIAQLQINYRVVIGDEALAKTFGGVDALPTTFLIDREGRIAANHFGLISRSVYDEEIVHLLGE